MNNQNHKDAFEQFLTDETNKHEMFASDAVWAQINKQVQGYKSWPALTVIAFLIVVGLSVATVLNYPPDNILAKIQYNDSVQLAHQKEQAAILASKPKDDNFENRISSQKITANTFAAIAKQHADIVPIAVPDEDKDDEAKTDVHVLLKANQPAGNTNATTSVEILPLNKVDKLSSIETSETDTMPVYSSEVKKDTENEATDNVYKDFYAARFSRKYARKQSKWSYDFYVTPSQSFRSLEDDKERDQYATSSNGVAPITSLSSTVKHKPALGLEAGFLIGYNLTSRLKLKAGVQFNIRQYYIDAYQTFGIATITIVQNNHLDSLSFYSRFGSAGNSYAQTKLDNRLYQLSIPLGVQWDALQGKRLGVSFGASVQPTFTLNKSVYLISTDYKYYANGESFFRKWNFNTALDLTISYKLRNSKIYVGPQVRYQHLPTYNDAYPIKEYRLDYGIKVGIIKSF